MVFQTTIATANSIDSVSVSPGRYDHKLGEGFPTEDRVRLDYPRSTILANRNGELLFNATLTTFNYSETDPSKQFPNSIVKSISIYIPPEFKINNGVASIWTSFTNDYSNIFLATAFSNDPIAPNWSIVTVSNLNITKSKEDVANQVFMQNRTQYIRVFNVTSPSTAGRYFFKVFINVGTRSFSIGSSNFPTIVVKAALNPAYISGVVRYGGSLQSNIYGKPIDASLQSDGSVLLPKGYGGRVFAQGLTAEGEGVQAQAFFNATAEGRYILYGLAPATYNITVQAAGYPPQLFINVATVTGGQSLENVDFYITEGTAITGTIFSKHGYGEIPWGYSYNLTSGTVRHEVSHTVRIDITDLDERIVASSPLRLFDEPLLTFRPRDTLDPSATNYHFSLKREVSFDGHIPQDYANYTSGILSGDYYVKAHVANYVQLDSTIVHVNNATKEIETAIDLQRTSYFEVTVHFKDKTNNLQPTPTFAGGYLYLEVLDAAGAVVGFNVSYVSKGSTDFTMQVRGTDIWNELLSDQSKRIAWAYSNDHGFLPGTYTINALLMNQTIDFVVINALIAGSPELRMIYPTTTSPLTAAFPQRTLEATNRQTPLYFQLTIIQASIGGFCNSANNLSFALARGAGFNITLYSVDWQRPSINREWAHPGSGIRIDIQDSDGNLIDTIYTTQPLPADKSVAISTLGGGSGPTFGKALGLKSGFYILRIYTPGYIEESLSSMMIPVILGDVSDARISLFRGAGIDLTLIFETENLLDAVDNRLLYAKPINNIDATPLRVEVFDDSGELVAANITYVDQGSTRTTVFLDGFNNYYGNPRLLWTNFYDTTDANRKHDSGLDEGVYMVRVTLAGYYQTEPLRVEINSGNVKSRPTVSLIASLERLGYLSGTVTWIDWSEMPAPLSWAAITAYNRDSSEETYNPYTYSLDGFYEIWLLPGDYDFGLSHPGFETKYLTNRLHVSWGSCTSIDFFMN